MYIDDFPNCCGAMVVCDMDLHQFEYEDGYYRIGEPRTKAQQEALFKKKLNNYKREMDGAFLFLILDQHQQETVGKLVEECGFKLVAKGRNPKHDSTLYTYCYSRKRLPKPKRDKNYARAW